MRPLIGIPCHEDFRQGSGRPIYCNNRTYSHAVENAGGIPVLISMLNDLAPLESLLIRLDGLLLSGGVDVHPGRYNEEAHPYLGEVDPRLDELELTLTHWALKENMPVLGICRGLQVLNVALGGTLYQDLGEEYPGSNEHCKRDMPRNTLVHRVQVEAGSLMREALGTNALSVNSIHHQAIKVPGKGVRISGYAEDGVAELMEVPDYGFVMGVQCHPEEIYTNEPACANLFSAFINACEARNTIIVSSDLPVLEKVKAIA